MCRGWIKPKEIRFQHVSELSKADICVLQFRWQIVPDSRSGNRKVSVVKTNVCIFVTSLCLDQHAIDSAVRMCFSAPKSNQILIKSDIDLWPWKLNWWQLADLLVWKLQFVFIVLLGLVFMGRHKCEAVACLSSQVICNFYELFIVHFNYGE